MTCNEFGEECISHLFCTAPVNRLSQSGPVQEHIWVSELSVCSAPQVVPAISAPATGSGGAAKQREGRKQAGLGLMWVGWSVVGGGRACAPPVGPFPLFGPVLGGVVCYKVVPAGGIAPDPSAPFAARGRPKYPPRGGGAGCPLRVRLRDIMGGSPLKRTWCRFFYGPVW